MMHTPEFRFDRPHLPAHPDVLEELCETLGEDRGSPSCKILRAHLDECPGCRAYVDSLLKTLALYRTAEDWRPPPGLKQRIFAAMNLPENDTD